MNSPERTQLTAILSTSLFERGNRIPDWPADEAAAYRVHRFQQGNEDARALRMSKAANAVLDAGYVKLTSADRLLAARAADLVARCPSEDGVQMLVELRELLTRISGRTS